jgi:hypothetical protein
LLALTRTHPLKEVVDEWVIREDVVLRWFPALLAHEDLQDLGQRVSLLNASPVCYD